MEAMTEFTFGANILEILTTGMYPDSKVIYREYIQNSCDQIDKAEHMGILESGQGIIEIWLKPEGRYIEIEDNATGIKASEFKRTLGNIADSEKIMGQDKGFRGIGRLCGLAYCKTLKFSSRWKDENVVSIMSCNAQKMRQLINDTNTDKTKKYSAHDVLTEMITFSTRPVEESDKEHFFKVELIDINEENEELFGGQNGDGFIGLRNYLSFIAPVPYDGNFIYRKKIYDYAQELNFPIDEYDLRINGEQIFKKYPTRLKTSKGDDHVHDLEFHEFRSDNNSLLGWMWFGQTNFIAAIEEKEISRGLRLRKENIQIGNDDTLKKMFSEPRGNGYFIGEVFAVSPELIPNSQRDYFNETPARIDFEHKLKGYFYTLYKIYRAGSTMNSNIKTINLFHEEKEKFEKKKTEGEFLSKEEIEKAELNLKVKEEAAKKARNDLAKKNEGSNTAISQIVQRRTEEIRRVVEKPISSEGTLLVQEQEEGYKPKKRFLTDSMFPHLNKSERKLLSETLEKIFAIIQNSTDISKKTAENLIARIKDELK